MSERALPQGATAEVPDESYHTSNVSPPDRLPESIIDAAITWAIRLNYNVPTVQDRRAFECWLNDDLLHGIAWQRVHSLKGFQSDLGALPPKLALDALQTVQARRAHLSLSRRNAMKLLSLAGIAVTAGWIVREQTPWQRLLADVSTGSGEQKTLHLDDGSVIVLNIDSAINTDLAGPRRLVVLRRGEILITTGADAGMSAKRPFWVYTPFGKMQALGTRFVVRLDKERARISVQEGAVALHPADGGVSAVVQAGESRWLMDDGTAPAELQGFEADGWAEGVIAGKNILLQDLLVELARYRPGHIVCDPRVADLRLSGLFHVKETDRALQFLVQTQPISVSYRTRFWITVGPREVH
ncbi:MAG: FecR family protein [Candidatus Nitrotoga sp. SPKER]|nr:MAG: FecR family protein [Candidatus Nitrotoga sp. SPKER]